MVCRQAGKKTALLDLASFTDEEMADYPTFLTVIAQEMWEQFGQPQRATPPRLTNQRGMIKYIQKALLDAIDGNVVVAFDEMDRVLGRSYQDNFFSTLRYLHDHRTDSPPTSLARLGLAGAISTEPYLFIKDLFRSPFNVGLNIELRNFNEAECLKLNRLYRARLTKVELGRLMALLNGHPHLTHLAFYSLVGPSPLDFPALLRKAAEWDGPFGAHLRAIENKLMDEMGEALLTAMKQIIAAGEGPTRDTFYRLHGAGLVREDEGRIVPVNQLYARFFGKL
jgi:hypothetical protein